MLTGPEVEELEAAGHSDRLWDGEGSGNSGRGGSSKQPVRGQGRMLGRRKAGDRRTLSVLWGGQRSRRPARAQTGPEAGARRESRTR